MQHQRVGAFLGLALATLLAGCGGGGSTQTDADSPRSTSTPTSTPTATGPPTATPAPAPDDDACYDLDLDDAVSPTNETEPHACTAEHTSQTFYVGTVDNLVKGHLLAVDSDQVQQQVASACPRRLDDLVGGDLVQRRLSMLKAVWFTPTVEESDAGADWFRCDVVVLGGAGGLSPVTGFLDGSLTTEQGRTRYGMCGTASPDDADFERVLCSAPHTWRAIDVVDLRKGEYPGESAVTASGREPCEDAGARVADDPLDYEWAYEGPDEEQWDAGQTFGRCWAPDRT